MLLILNGDKHELHASQLNALYRQRFEHFVVRRKWPLATRARMDIDQYDGQTATYFILQDEEQRTVASARVHRSTDASLLNDLFPHLNESGEPSADPGIFEGTRFIVDAAACSAKAQQLARIDLVRAIASWCLDQGGTHLQAIVDAGMLARFTAMSVRARPLGLAHDYGGGPRTEGGGRCIAFRWALSRALLDDFDAYRAEAAAPSVASDAVH